MIKWIQSLINSFNEEPKGSTLIFCPKCKDILNGQSKYNYITVETGIYRYECIECNNISEFNFNLAPVPICTSDNVIEETLRTQSQTYYTILSEIISLSNSHLHDNELHTVIAHARKAIETHDNI
jgi:hypothetical protein